jgi:hypothetical protein
MNLIEELAQHLIGVTAVNHKQSESEKPFFGPTFEPKRRSYKINSVNREFRLTKTDAYCSRWNNVWLQS